MFGASLYAGDGESGAPEAAINASLGCGVPTAVADLHEGETVLDLGSGAGADVLISARRVGPTGKAIGLDMTDEMLELARANAARRASRTSSSSRATSRTCRCRTQTVDVVISNCVINLSGDKPSVLRGGSPRASPGRPVRGLRRDRRSRHGRADPRRHGRLDGLHRRRADRERVPRGARQRPASSDIEIRETHRVHEHAAAAIVRARKPQPRV